MSERITETDYRVEQQRLNAQGRAATHGRLVASSPQIRANGYELRRTPTGSALVQVRKPHAVNTPILSPRAAAPRET